MNMGNFTTLFLLLLYFLTPTLSERPKDWPDLPKNLPELNCDIYQTETETCTVKKEIKSGFKWIKPTSTVFFDGVITNLKSSHCIIYSKAENVWLVETNLKGCDVIIEATFTFKLYSSTISVDGVQKGGPGASKSPIIGHSFGGNGASCSSQTPSDYSYGNYSMEYYNDFLAKGSGGDNDQTAGYLTTLI